MFSRRCLTNSIIRRRWYTPFGSHVCDDNPLTLYREKERLLKGKVKDILKSAPGWNELLASDSEAMIKAEREPDPLSMKELQNDSLKFLSRLDDDIEVVETIKKEVNFEKIEERKSYF